MATTLTHAALPDAERRFYSRMAIALAVVVLAGFSSTFYLPGIVVFPRPTPSYTPLMVVHGVVFTAWMPSPSPPCRPGWRRAVPARLR